MCAAHRAEAVQVSGGWHVYQFIVLPRHPLRATEYQQFPQRAARGNWVLEARLRGGRRKEGPRGEWKGVPQHALAEWSRSNGLIFSFVCSTNAHVGST